MGPRCGPTEEEAKMTATLTGRDAINYSAATGATLNKYTDPMEPARSGLTVGEAETVAAEDPALVWVEIDASSYVVLDDGQARWPASAAAVSAYDGDPVSDEGCATAGAIPTELMPLIGGAVGSVECGALCARLIEEGAELIRV